MTEGIFSAIESTAGQRPIACPWRAFSDPFVQRVLDAYGSEENGNLMWSHPSPSYRLREGVLYYRRVSNSIYAQQLELERIEREQEAARRG